MADPDPIRRPRARNARPKIERAALKLFVTKSVEAATTREIAEEAGVSEGALYRHYPGKDDLALALFMETHNRLGRMMIEGFMAGDSLEDRIRRAVAAYCQLADEDWLLFSFHLLSMNKFLPHDIRRDDDPVTITETLIQGLMDSGEIPKGDPALLAAMSLGVMTQAGQNKAYNRLPGELGQHVGAFTKAILAILKQK
ncbi:MAG: TetR/AcrR family transcriptional regulator [Hyphomonadaceae bacterium]|nr:TetR/AcrR family transcriptional regulator [Hyphomonadaceae bacterium]